MGVTQEFEVGARPFINQQDLPATLEVQTGTGPRKFSSPGSMTGRINSILARTAFGRQEFVVYHSW